MNFAYHTLKCIKILNWFIDIEYLNEILPEQRKLIIPNFYYSLIWNALQYFSFLFTYNFHVHLRGINFGMCIFTLTFKYIYVSFDFPSDIIFIFLSIFTFYLHIKIKYFMIFFYLFMEVLIIKKRHAYMYIPPFYILFLFDVLYQIKDVSYWCLYKFVVWINIKKLNKDWVTESNFVNFCNFPYGNLNIFYSIFYWIC